MKTQTRRVLTDKQRQGERNLMKSNERAVAMVNGKMQNHKAICISMYIDDLDVMDEMVKRLKRAGYTKASRSWLIRQSLQQFDLAKLAPRSSGGTE